MTSKQDGHLTSPSTKRLARRFLKGLDHIWQRPPITRCPQEREVLNKPFLTRNPSPAFAPESELIPCHLCRLHTFFAAPAGQTCEKHHGFCPLSVLFCLFRGLPLFQNLWNADGPFPPAAPGTPRPAFVRATCRARAPRGQGKALEDEGESLSPTTWQAEVTFSGLQIPSEKVGLGWVWRVRYLLRKYLEPAGLEKQTSHLKFILKASTARGSLRPDAMIINQFTPKLYKMTEIKDNKVPSRNSTNLFVTPC